MRVVSKIRRRWTGIYPLNVHSTRVFSVKGRVLLSGTPPNYPCQIFLSDAYSFVPQQRSMSDENGNYEFNNLPNQPFIVTALHPNKQYNAVIQDMVVPK